MICNQICWYCVELYNSELHGFSKRWLTDKYVQVVSASWEGGGCATLWPHHRLVLRVNRNRCSLTSLAPTVTVREINLRIRARSRCACVQAYTGAGSCVGHMWSSCLLGVRGNLNAPTRSRGKCSTAVPCRGVVAVFIFEGTVLRLRECVWCITNAEWRDIGLAHSAPNRATRVQFPLATKLH